jgi:transcriptional regulator with XRE-family HTH domain
MATEHTSDLLQKPINPVDLYVGARVRLRRKFLGLSQQMLAEGVGLTFQQIQKYERGANRISASKLFEISKLLKVPVASFFEGYDTDEYESLYDNQSERSAHAFLMSTEGVEIAQAFPRIVSRNTRRKLLELVRSLGEE